MEKDIKINKVIIFTYKSKFIYQKIISRLFDPDSKSLVDRVYAITGLKKSSIINKQKKIKDINLKLYSLGFIERAPAELKTMIASDVNSERQRLAARELALWYASQHNAEHAKQCLELLDQEFYREKNPDRLRKTAIMKTECHQILGDDNQAQEALNRALAVGLHADLFLACANLETSIDDKIIWINKALALHGISEIAFDRSAEAPGLDCLKAARRQADNKKSLPANKHMISVIMPAYNAQDTIRTSLKAILAQTWTNLELLVVDDASTDETVSIVQEYTEREARVKLIRNEKNRGPYVARNRALKEAGGEFITCHDADDWSHPELLERQARHLLKKPAVIGNISQQIRTTPDLKFIRRDRYGILMIKNFPSFMFRRRPVTESLGFWDCVRFSADHELIRRVEKVFGEDAVVNLSTGPLCFQREHPASLTGDPLFGTKGHYRGARKEYYEAQTYYHDTAANLFYAFPQEPRLFPVPEPMRVNWEERFGGSRHFDVVIGSDFRLNDDAQLLNLEEIRVQIRKGYKIGLIQMCRYDIEPNRTVSSKVRELIDGEQVQMLVYGEKISCLALIINHFPVLFDWQKFIPDVKADNIHVVVDELPGLDLESGGYDDIFQSAVQNLKRYFKKPGLWHPLDRAIREVLSNFCEHTKEPVMIAEQDRGKLESCRLN